MALSKAQTHLTITTVTFKSSPLQIKKNPGCEKDTTMTFVDSFILEFNDIISYYSYNACRWNIHLPHNPIFQSLRFLSQLS